MLYIYDFKGTQFLFPIDLCEGPAQLERNRMNEALVSTLCLLHDCDEDIIYSFCPNFSFSSCSRCLLKRKGSMTQPYVWILYLKQQRFLIVVQMFNHL